MLSLLTVYVTTVQMEIVLSLHYIYFTALITSYFLQMWVLLKIE